MSDQLKTKVQDQYNSFLNRGGIPCMEYPLGDGDFLVVEVGVTEDGVVFSFDQCYDVWFDGEIEELGHGCFMFPFSESVYNDLDEILQAIDGNIRDGYLSPNGLIYND